jgi:hypothetical protein
MKHERSTQVAKAGIAILRATENLSLVDIGFALAALRFAAEKGWIKYV